MTEQKKYKLVTFVPVTHADVVRDAMGLVGAGVIGNYSFCTFSSIGVGRFKGGEGSHPSVGTVGKLESVEEERIETICPEYLVQSVIDAVKKVHPYEEVPFDIYPILTY